MRMAPAVLVVAAVLVVGGCAQSGSSGTGEPDGTVPPTLAASSTPAGQGKATRPQLTELPLTPPPPTTGDPEPGQAPAGSAAEAAVHDLAQRVGLATDQVTVVRVEEVTWNDSSLGCPKPGAFYAQVITPGSLIVLEAAGRSYEYHAADGRAPVLCERPHPPGASPS